MTDTLRLGFSSCPNDTFMFHALVHGEVVVPDTRFSVVMEDIEALNERALGPVADRVEVTKLSVGVLPRAAEHYAVLAAGAALGRGNGPLVVARPGAFDSLAQLSSARIAIPGVLTTANLLLSIFGPADVQRVPMRFDRIMPAIVAREVDAGLIIHESRFTYPDHGLTKVADLGEVWEADTGLPLPLGVICADRSLPAARIDAIEAGLRASVQAAFADPSRSRAYVRAHAQEMTDEVCEQHIGLYVGDFSVDLGDEGRAAIESLLRRADERTPSPWR